MRVMVLGGTRFIGAAIVEELHDHGHEQLLVHRGEHEPDGAGRLADHLHADRRDLPHLRGAVADFDPEALVDTGAMSAADAEAALAAVGDGTRLLVLSSMDVYRAFGAMLAGTETDALPLDETSPVRPERYPYRGHPRLGGEAWLQEYEKLDVEAAYLARERRGSETQRPTPLGWVSHSAAEATEGIHRQYRRCTRTAQRSSRCRPSPPTTGRWPPDEGLQPGRGRRPPPRPRRYGGGP